MFGTFDISTSALIAQRIRMDAISGNVSNAWSTERADGRPGPYQRRVPLFSVGDDNGGPGVHVSRIVEDPAPPRRAYDPGHPHVDRSGYVDYPNVDLNVEMVNMIEAVRAYEANVTALEVTKSMTSSTLRLLA